MKFGEVFSIAFQSIFANKLRTFLTVLGVVVGIFSIIVIMTIVTMLQTSIEDGFSQLSKNTFQIEKFDRLKAHGPHRDRSWRNRKDITIDEFDRFKEMMTQAKYVGAEQWQFGKMAKYGSEETNPNLSVAGITLGAMYTNDWKVAYGREMRPNDIKYSNDVCLLGRDVVDKLFPNVNPIGQTVRVDNKPLKVIGVLEKQTQLFGQSRDSFILMPITTFQNKYGKTGNSINITVMAQNKESYEATIDAAIGYMRKIRKVSAGQDNDFSIFSNESLISQVDTTTKGVRVGALVVSIFALIAAGVGIMNIMLVSVTERTREIGIRKALGARRTNILSQFLIEAVVLCLIGGIIGIIIGVGIGNLAGGALNAKAAIPYSWVAIGMSLCVLVGVGFGTYPAYKAANLDPIEALRYE
jgi:putative ABC transport system permease protein